LLTLCLAVELRVELPARVGLSSEELAKVDAFMQQQIEDGRTTGGIVMVARNGHAAFVHTYGQMDREANIPFRRDAIFRFRSMTKAITTAAALRLVENGRLRLDDPVSKGIGA
jgi:CubicO group peptidase (beta-lactamase class C family)